MTKQEASAKYNIPIEIMDEYESWGLYDDAEKAAGERNYDDTDIERLGLIMTLRYIGFDNSEAERYMRLLKEGGSTEGERMSMLEKLRKEALDEIHLKEKQLESMDYLRHKIRNRK